MSKSATILIPTYNRPVALTATLTSLLYQQFTDFDIIISDQGDNYPISPDPTVQALVRIFRIKGHAVTILKNLPRQGMGQQRQFLLDKSKTAYSLFLDDDLILEPFVLEIMVKAIREEQCGFVGQAVIGLSYINDFRENEQVIEFWEGDVEPEKVTVNSKKWKRHQLHNAANLLHVQNKLKITPLKYRKYKTAWVGGCILYDTNKLRESGGFDFWRRVPNKHSGEDVVAQLRVMEKYGGCGIMPSGVYHQELKTTIPDRLIDLPKYLLA